MEFLKFQLGEDGSVVAVATGHASDVIKNFHDVCAILLYSRGPWRITTVRGTIADHTLLDSDMSWVLEANVKQP